MGFNSAFKGLNKRLVESEGRYWYIDGEGKSTP